MATIKSTEVLDYSRLSVGAARKGLRIEVQETSILVEPKLRAQISDMEYDAFQM